MGWVRDVGIELDHLGVPLVQVRRGQNLYTCRCSEENITDISSDNALFMMVLCYASYVGTIVNIKPCVVPCSCITILNSDLL